MLLRRVIEHVKTQNWTAVALDFVIVVVGVFIGIQVANWNEERAFEARERSLLVELKRELAASIETTDHNRQAISQVRAAAKRSIEFIDNGADCGDECWPAIADFYHASQWFPTDIGSSVYEEMRRLGLPRSRAIVDQVEAYLAQNAITVDVLSELPAYRTHVRGLIPVAVHDVYWTACYSLKDGKEDLYIEDCPQGAPNEVTAPAVAAIAQHPETRSLLTFWYSEITPTPAALADQNAMALRAIAAIDAELEKR